MNKVEYEKKKLEIYRKITRNENFNIEFATDDILCKTCKGACCKNFPCAFSPDDFADINDLDYMKKLLDTGYFVIDSFLSYNNEKIYYLRLRGKKDKKVILIKKYIISNKCIFHKRKCLLDFYIRPTGGALLIPRNSRKGLGTCYNEYTFREQVDDWKAYQNVLVDLIKYYEDKKIKVPRESKVYKLERLIRNED